VRARERDGQAPGEGGVEVTVPSHRAGRDVSMEADLVEEIGRQFGYDRIPSRRMLAPIEPRPLPDRLRLERKVRAVCALGRGLQELHQHSFDHEPTRDRLGLAASDALGQPLPRVRLANTLSSEQVALRRNVADGLLAATERNLASGGCQTTSQKGFRVGVFEIGRVALPDRSAPDGPDLGVPPPLVGADQGAREAYLALIGPALAAEAEQAARDARPLPLEALRLALAVGERLGGVPGDAAPGALTTALWRRLVGAVEAIFAACALGQPLLRARHRDDPRARAARRPASAVDARPGWLHPARHAVVYAWSGEGALVEVGLLSMLHPRARAALELPAEVALGELDLDALAGLQVGITRAGRPPRFPASEFDLTVPVRADVASDQVRAAAGAALSTALGDRLEQCAVVSTWEGGDATYPRAVTLRIRLRDDDRTLRDAEVTRARACAVEALCGWRDGGDQPPVAADLAARVGLAPEPR
jgi:phenylalanyl-tRNA synthetase beta chain